MMSDTHEHATVVEDADRVPCASDPFVAAVLAARMPMIITDPRQADNPIIFANEAFSELTGYSTEDILGRNCRILQGPDTDHRETAKLRDAIARRVPIEVEFQNYRKTGEVFWNRLLVVPVFGGDGELNYFLASQFDVSHEHDRLHDLNEQLRRNESILDALIRSSSEVRYRISADWSSLHQLAGGDFIMDTASDNRTWLTDYIPPEDRAAVQAEYERAIHDKSTYDLEHRVYLVDGSIGWAASRAVPMFDARGTITEWFGAASDITERKTAEAALRASEERLRRQEAYWRGLFERLDEGFMVVEIVRDGAGTARTWRFAEANAAWERLTGLSFAAARGRNAEDVVPGIEREWQEMHIRVAETGEPETVRMPTRALGRIFDARASRIDIDRVGVLFHEVSAQQREEARRAALLQINDALDWHDDTARLADVACAILGETLEVQLVGYGAVDPDAETITVERDWTRSGAQSLAGTLNFREFGNYIDDLKRGETVVVADVRTDPRTRAFAAALEARSARAFVNTPVFERGRFVALQYTSTDKPRVWSEDELSFIGEVARRTRSATARRQAEHALRVLNASLERQVTDRTAERDRAWSLARDLLVIARPDGVIEAVNPAWTVVLGWKEQDLIGRSFVAFAHPDDLDDTLAAFVGIKTAPLTTPYEYRFRHHDGSYRWIGWTGASDAGLIYACGRDLTLQRAQAETLRQSEKRATTFFNFSDDYLFLARLGADGIVRFDDMNPACERVMGVRRADVLGRSVEAFVPAESAADITKHTRACLESSRPQSYLAVREYRGGSKVVINGRVAFVERLEDGGGLVLFSGNDVTEQHRTEEALRQAQKMEAVGQLTGGLAHDFNNLLAGISGALEMMQARIAKGRFADLGRYMTMAQGATKRAAALTHRLLAFSRRQTLDPRPTDVGRLMSGIEDMVTRTIGPQVALEVDGAAGSWSTLIDPGQLENALLNLCINARDAMPDGGRIVIKTANERLDEAAAAALDVPEGEYLSICVADTGTGMPPDVVAKVFDPFFTTKPIGVGTGLGLSMIYGFAKQSGGQVRIASEVGRGTSVYLYLPRYHGDAEEDDAALEPVEAVRAAPNETVLIVDDEPTVRALITEVLHDLGFIALEAADSAAGLRVLHSDARIDLLVTDVGLPGGMNGRQMADAGRERRPGLKVLFITGYAETAATGIGQLSPGMQVLTKPFPMEALTACITELIGSHVRPEVST